MSLGPRVEDGSAKYNSQTLLFPQEWILEPGHIRCYLPRPDKCVPCARAEEDAEDMLG